jgi:hypothetical protein
LRKQTQDLGKAMGYTYGGQVVLYFIFQLFGTFGFIFQMQKAEPLTIVGYLSTALLFFWLIHVFCNAADRATKFVRKELINVFTVLLWGQICRRFREAEFTIQL